MRNKILWCIVLLLVYIPKSDRFMCDYAPSLHVCVCVFNCWLAWHLFSIIYRIIISQRGTTTKQIIWIECGAQLVVTFDDLIRFCEVVRINGIIVGLWFYVLLRILTILVNESGLTFEHLVVPIVRRTHRIYWKWKYFTNRLVWSTNYRLRFS